MLWEHEVAGSSPVFPTIFKRYIMYKFEKKYCSLCDCDVTICPKCGNNTCNGGYGTVDGKECDVCPLAYEHEFKTNP